VVCNVTVYKLNGQIHFVAEAVGNFPITTMFIMVVDAGDSVKEFALPSVKWLQNL
jgi:hypothetical protein